MHFAATAQPVIGPPARHLRRRHDDIATKAAHIDMEREIAAIGDRRAAVIRPAQPDMHAARLCYARERGWQRAAHLRLQLRLQPLQCPDFARCLIMARVEIEHEQPVMACCDAYQGIGPALPPGADLIGIAARLLDAASLRDLLAVRRINFIAQQWRLGLWRAGEDTPDHRRIGKRSIEQRTGLAQSHEMRDAVSHD